MTTVAANSSKDPPWPRPIVTRPTSPYPGRLEPYPGTGSFTSTDAPAEHAVGGGRRTRRLRSENERRPLGADSRPDALIDAVAEFLVDVLECPRQHLVGDAV